MTKYKKYSMLMCSVGLMLLLVGVTYSFFNYTRTGNPNNFSVGRISFVSRNEETISLNNLFPIDPTESGIMNDSTKVGTYEIDIVGDTDYADGIEYLVSITDANIYTSSGKTIPISLNITPNGLGNENSNYFTARESKDTTMYKRLGSNTIVGDGMIMVGYIKPNTTQGTAEGVNGSITIKAYLDENNIAVSDTYDGTESDSNGTTNDWVNGRTVLTTTEWNNLSNTGISFKVKVEAQEGIWVLGSLEEIMRRNAVMDNTTSTYVSAATGIDFGAASSDTNGKGVYMRAGTENDSHPIMYYRGNVTDNNVIFGNKCWKVIRTTDGGGVKLIYNGETGHVFVDDNYDLSAYSNITRTGNQFEFDTNTNEWKVTLTVASGGSSGEANIKFTVSEAGNYTLKFNHPGSGPITATRGGTSLNPVSGVNEIALNNLTTNEEINIAYTHYNAAGAQVVMKIALNKGQIDAGIGCDNTGTESQITLNIQGTDVNTFKFSTDSGADDSLAYNGYMYGDIYTFSSSDWTSGARFGSGFTWDGTSYTLVGDNTTTPDSTHHYSCNVTTQNGTCAQIRYVFYTSGNLKYYITLTGGENVEQAINKMQTNTYSSNAKNKIETWYANNMTSYTQKIEDTVYCSDRSMNNTNGWNANGGDLTTEVLFGGLLRAPYNGTATPSLACINKNDSFTWKNSKGNAKLQYPVGMITSDEMILAGNRYGYPSSTYLETGQDYWAITPCSYVYYSLIYNKLYNGILSNYFVGQSLGLRPVISIKSGQLIKSGTGTVADPYVIE